MERDNRCPLCAGEVDVVLIVDVTHGVEQFSPSEALDVGRCQLCNEQLHRAAGESNWRSKRYVPQLPGEPGRLP
jgi:uncharacterized protein with PIN domain